MPRVEHLINWRLLRAIHSTKGRAALDLRLYTCPPDSLEPCTPQFLRMLHLNEQADGPPFLPQTTVAIGQGMIFQIRAEREGHVYLFNLGTSGACHRLWPYYPEDATHLAPGAALRIPPRGDGAIDQAGPTTSAVGSPDYYLALLLRNAIDLRIEDLDPRLHKERAEFEGEFARNRAEAPETRRAATAAASNLPYLFTLPLEDWDFGVIALDIQPSATLAEPSTRAR